METLDNKPEGTPLARQFNEIVNRVEIADQVHVERIDTNSKQYKFFIDDANSLFRNIESCGGVIAGTPSQQSDEYYLEPDELPSYQTETLCWRVEQPFINYSGGEEGKPSFALIYKTNPFTEGSENRRESLSVKTEDNEVIMQLYEAVGEVRDGNDFTPYKVTKQRTIYKLPLPDGGEVRLHVDKRVCLSNKEQGEDGSLRDFEAYVGDFLEISTKPEEPAQTLDKIKTMLGIVGETFDVPYIDKPRFTVKSLSERPSMVVEAPKTSEWSLVDYPPYYFDSSKGIVVGIDPHIVNRLDKNSSENLEAIVRGIIDDLNASEGGRTLKCSRSSGSGGASRYERFQRIDAFKKFPTIKSELRYSVVYRRKVDHVGGFQIVIFSSVEFNNGSKGIFIHKACDHQEYDRWKSQHQS